MKKWVRTEILEGVKDSLEWKGKHAQSYGTNEGGSKMQSHSTKCLI